MEINWDKLGIEWDDDKYFRTPLMECEKKSIQILKKGDFFLNSGHSKWLSVYYYEDGEYVICLDKLGEAYYESSVDNERFGAGFNFRIEDSLHVFMFIDKYIMDDRNFLQ